ncbi:hypothetical protein EON81_26160 [bacterium]|nr:MAG: hypothetical protein EON81_26160 [bacterium]
MKFYNLKTRQHVDVPDADVKKRKSVSKTKSGGEQTRYQFVAEHEGAKLFKFVSEADYSASKAKEIE